MSRKPIYVLSIEDNPGDEEWIQAFLTEDEHTSFNIVCTGSLATGLIHLAEHDVDIILLDLVLPDRQDLATIATLRDRAPAVPIVVMANLDDETLAAQIVRAGAQEYLVKGRIGRDGMIRVIRYAIERRRADEALHAVKAYTENLINSSLDMIVTVDTDYRIILFNPAAEQALGYRQVDVVGKSVDIIYPHQTECVYIVSAELLCEGIFL